MSLSYERQIAADPYIHQDLLPTLGMWVIIILLIVLVALVVYIMVSAANRNRRVPASPPVVVPASNPDLDRAFAVIHRMHPEYPMATNIIEAENICTRYIADDTTRLSDVSTISDGVRDALAAGGITRASQAMGFIVAAFKTHKNDIHDARQQASMAIGDRTRLTTEVARLNSELSAARAETSTKDARIQQLYGQLTTFQDGVVENTKKSMAMMDTISELLKAGNAGDQTNIAVLNAKLEVQQKALDGRDEMGKLFADLAKAVIAQAKNAVPKPQPPKTGDKKKTGEEPIT